MVAGRRPRCPRPVHRALVLCRRHGPAAPDPQHPRAAVSQPVPGGQGGGHPRRALRRTVHARRRHRLHARRVQGARVDFEQRNALFDEAIEVIRGVWSEDDFAYEGSTFSAKGQTANPKPIRTRPIWIGGNSRLSRRRVARYGDGWTPFPAPRTLASTAKTPPARDRRRPAPDARRALAVHGGSRPRPGQHRRVVRHRRRGQPGRRQLQPRRPPWRPPRSWRRSASPGRGPACPATRWPTLSRPSSASAQSVIR